MYNFIYKNMYNTKGTSLTKCRITKANNPKLEEGMIFTVYLKTFPFSLNDPFGQYVEKGW